MSEILRLITEFTRAVEKQGEGKPGCDGLLQQIRPWQDAFRVAIRKTAPCFVPQFKRVAAPVSRTASPAPSLWSESSNLAQYERPPSPVPCVVQRVEPHRNPLFLVGEEHHTEIGLDDGKEIFIDDVLETAEWCVPQVISGWIAPYSQRSFHPGRLRENCHATTLS
jgi:hypothetical protein